jgi:hypothetical protein
MVGSEMMAQPILQKFGMIVLKEKMLFAQHSSILIRLISMSRFFILIGGDKQKWH